MTFPQNGSLPSSPLLTAAEAAVWLRLAEVDAGPEDLEAAAEAVHRMVRAGRLRPTPVGRRHMFMVGELEAFCARETAAYEPPGGAT